MPASHKKIVFIFHNHLLSKFLRLRWLDNGFVLFREFMDRDRVEVYKNAESDLWQYSAILTEQAWLKTHIYKSLIEGIKCDKAMNNVTFTLV